MTCNTTGNNLNSELIGDDVRGCEMSFDIEDQSINCHALDCHFILDASRVTCDVVTCACEDEGDCGQIEVMAQLISGMALECGDDRCQIELKGIDMVLDLPCQFSECQLPYEIVIETMALDTESKVVLKFI